VMTSKQDGATTVSATMLLAAAAGNSMDVCDFLTSALSVCARGDSNCRMYVPAGVTESCLLHFGKIAAVFCTSYTQPFCLCTCRHFCVCYGGHRRRAQVHCMISALLIVLQLVI